MRTVTVVLIVSLLMLSLIAACGTKEETTVPNAAANESGTAAPTVGNVTETTIEEGTPTETAPEDAETPDEETTDSEPDTTPAANITLTPPKVTSGCPLISAEDVAGACNKSAIPNATIDGLTCRFSWGEYEVNVTSISATMGDYNAWEASIPTTQGGHFKPASALAEYNKMKYYGWFTGKRLITVSSNNVLGCTLNRLDAVIERVDVEAKVTGEASTADKLASAVEDTGKKTLTSADLITMLTMKFDRTLDFEGNYSGSVKTAWSSSGYKLVVTLEKMPKATYKGYLVRKTNWHTFKLGPLEETSDAYRLMYSSSTDLRDHNWFVLTKVTGDAEEILSETSLT